MVDSAEKPTRVLIVGGGVAGLEAALALRDLAGMRVDTTMLAPSTEFVYRPLRVREPFAERAAPQYRLDEIARDIGIEFKRDAFRWLDPGHRVVHTEQGAQLPYDALLLALGARSRPRFKHALTIDDRQLDTQLHGLIQDMENGYIHTFAFITPREMPWPLPLYELALMTARRAFEMNEGVSITIVTHEASALQIFGNRASDAVGELLAKSGIELITSAHCETPQRGQVAIEPGNRRLWVDRIIGLPELFGPSAPGVPKRGGHGFIPIDAYCRVPGLQGVFAAGDATEFPVKHGGVAAQQANVAARAIAALAGATVEPIRFHPVIHGILLGGEKPLYLSAQISGDRGLYSRVSKEPTWSPGAKIDAEYLAPYLESHAAFGQHAGA